MKNKNLKIVFVFIFHLSKQNYKLFIIPVTKQRDPDSGQHSLLFQVSDFSFYLRVKRTVLEDRQ